MSSGYWMRQTSELDEICDQSYCDYVISAGEEYFQDDDNNEICCTTCWELSTLESHEDIGD